MPDGSNRLIPIECIADECTPGHKLVEKDGTCEKCGLYTKVTADLHGCEPEKCERNEKLNKDGTCEECGPYQRPDDEGTKCKFHTCAWNFKLLETGDCERCPDYE